MIWTHNFGAQRLLSSAGSFSVVAQAPDLTVTAIGAVSGRVVFKKKVRSTPFVGRDGAIVTADRKGKPTWLVTGGDRR
jgi:hypothetical protein